MRILIGPQAVQLVKNQADDRLPLRGSFPLCAMVGNAGTKLFRPAAIDALQMGPVSKRANSSWAPDKDPTLIEWADATELSLED
jgi:hypothetical protein